MAKTTPYPPCTVTAFWLKYQDRDRMLAPDASVGAGSGNTTSPYCRAVSTNAPSKLASLRPMINYLDIETLCHLY